MKKIKCPLCLGSKTVIIKAYYGLGSYEKQCSGCDGRGWIEASDDSKREEYKEKEA